MPKKMSVWDFTEHDYMTPEAITAATKAGIDKDTLWKEVLQAVENKNCEDTSLCAFVALKWRKKRK